MDALSAILSSAQLSRRIEALATFAEPWGVLYEPSGPAPSAMLHLVTEGHATLRAGGQLPMRIERGDLVLVPDGGAHLMSDHPESRALTPTRALDRNAALMQTHSGPTATVLSVRYAQGMVEAAPILGGLPGPVVLRADKIGALPQLRLMVDLIRAEARAPGAGRDMVLPGLTEALLALALRAWLDDAPRGLRPSWLKGMTDPHIARVLGGMHAAPGAAWSLAALATDAGLARATFARRFGDLVGETPMAYLNRWRMILAAARIRDDAMPVEAAAEAHGYASAAAFSRAFRRHFGYPPSRLRRIAMPVPLTRMPEAGMPGMRQAAPVPVPPASGAALRPPAFLAATLRSA